MSRLLALALFVWVASAFAVCAAAEARETSRGLQEKATKTSTSTSTSTKPGAETTQSTGTAPSETSDATAANETPCELRVAVAEFPPYATIEPGGTWAGESVELFRAVARDIGCETAFIGMTPTETLRALERGEVDAVALPLTANPLSASIMTLSPSFATSHVAIAVYRDDFRGDLAVLFRSLTSPRQLRVYAAMIALVILFAVLIWVLERSKNQHFRGRHREGLGSGLWWSITTLSTVGYGDKVPVSAVGRFFAGTWMVLSLVLVAIFTATVTSSITAHDTSVEVNGAHDLPRARVGVVENGLASGFVNDHFLPHVSYASLPLAIEELRAGHLDAVVADQHSLERAIAREPESRSRIVLLEKPIERSPVSFGLRKTLSRETIRRFDDALIHRLQSQSHLTPAERAAPVTGSMNMR